MNKNNSPCPRWGNNIKALMDIHGKNANDMAAELHVTTQAIYNLINKGVELLSAKRAAQLQTMFGTPYHKIFPLIEE